MGINISDISDFFLSGVALALVLSHPPFLVLFYFSWCIHPPRQAKPVCQVHCLHFGPREGGGDGTLRYQNHGID